MNNFRPVDRGTRFLLPPSVEEWLPERHLARFVVETVDQLDVSSLSGRYRGTGSAAYHPGMLLGLMIYGYATGVFASRKIERATYDSVAFRLVATNEHPDPDTLATFRRRFLPQMEGLFVRVLELAGAMGLLKLGTVGLDGTKIHANASRHSALSYGYAKKLEKQLRREVKQRLRRAERADAQDVPDGMSIPEELARREVRLAARAEQERRTPEPPTDGVRDQDQINLTDEDSRIMPVAGSGFEQCYHAQAVVTSGSLEYIRGQSPFMDFRGRPRCACPTLVFKVRSMVARKRSSPSGVPVLQAARTSLSCSGAGCCLKSAR